MMKNIYIASCAKDGGIYLCDFENETLSTREIYPCDRPMFLAKSGNKFYTVLRQACGDFSALVNSSVNEDGTLSDFGSPVSTEGIVACHLCVHENDVYFTNYLSGSVSRIRNGVCDKLSVHSGKGVHQTRQDAPHTHFVGITPDGNHLVSTDLGIDTIFVYDFDLNIVSKAAVPAGHGARHLVFSKDGKKMYCANELASTVSVFNYDAQSASLSLLGTYPALPHGFDGQSTIAAIRISDDGKYLYTSNRGHDSITCFEICGDTLNALSHTPCGGKSPRDFNIKDGLLFCTNEVSGNVTVFECNGANLKKLDAELSVPGALCVIF